MTFSAEQYNDPLIAGGFHALGQLLGREKACLSGAIAKEYTRTVGNSKSDATAVILGGGTGWEAVVLNKLGVQNIGFFEPAHAMRAKAEEIVKKEGIKGITFFGVDDLQAMVNQFGGSADWVQSCHVIPAIQTYEKLQEHFVSECPSLR